ncbi:MAG: cation:proton antiporter, partial [Candidatus Competibacteraceae bacterium]|nr:cation:proton antiporter [Candidatus Competibacteraceae bacterium]
FSGAAVLATIALFARQSLLVGYILLGSLVGPYGLGLVSEPRVISQIGHVGIIFLLFLLGLDLHPQKLLVMLREATMVTLATAVAFVAIGAGVALIFGFAPGESLLIGAVMMFSSTIIGLKLLPTTTLHHKRMGEIVISILLLQDIIAILILLLLQGLSQEGLPWLEAVRLVLALPLVAGLAFVAARYMLVPLIARFDTIQEYVFLLAIGWCLGMAQLAHSLGLSYEMGAFIAGVGLATSHIAWFITENLKPLRDFFLIMFFFSVGAGFEIGVLPQVLLPALALAGSMLALKPLIFRFMLMRAGEKPGVSWEIGVRLGQISEFALLIAVLAVQARVIGEQASYLIQAATLLTFIVSSYGVMLFFPTPIAVSDRLRRN